MSLHRDIRTMNYDEECEGSNDVFGYSLEEDQCVSPIRRMNILILNGSGGNTDDASKDSKPKTDSLVKPPSLAVNSSAMKLKSGNLLFGAQRPLLFNSSTSKSSNPLFASQKPLVLPTFRLLNGSSSSNEAEPPENLTCLVIQPAPSLQPRTQFKPKPKVFSEVNKRSFKILQVPKPHLDVDAKLIKEPSQLGSRFVSGSAITYRIPEFFHHDKVWPVLQSEFNEKTFKFDSPSPDAIVNLGLSNQPTGYQRQAASN